MSRILLHCLSSDMAILGHEWATASGRPGGRKDGHVVLQDRRAKCHCPAARRSRRDAGAEAQNFHSLDAPDTAKVSLYERLGVARHRSRAAEVSPAWVKTRARSEGFALKKMVQRLGVSGVGALDIAAAAAAAHRWGRMVDSYSGTRRQETDAAELGIGRCMAERRSW